MGDMIAESWRSFVRGLGNTLGIAPVRRPVESPEEAMRAVSDELRQAVVEMKAMVARPEAGREELVFIVNWLAREVARDYGLENPEEAIGLARKEWQKLEGAPRAAYPDDITELKSMGEEGLRGSMGGVVND